MKTIPLLLLMLGLVGCEPDKPITSRENRAVVAGPHRPTDAQILEGLRFEAKKRGLSFVVFCVPGDEGKPNYYQADAQHKSDPEDAIYIEEGMTPWWASTGPTAEDAAYALYLALAKNDPPNQLPDHKPDPACNYNHVYDDAHDHKLPCPKGKP